MTEERTPPPHDLEAERALLGVLMVEPAAQASVAWLTAADFYRPGHALLWDTVVRLSARGDAADVVSVRRALGREAEKVGGAAYLSQLVDGVPRTSNAAAWARAIRDLATRRKLARVGQRLHELAMGAEGDSASLVERALGGLLEVSGRVLGDEPWRDNAADARQALREIEQQAQSPDGVLGLRTGLPDLDAILQGLRPGQLGLIAARLKEGKSVLAMQIAEHAAEQGTDASRVAVFSLEMSGPQLAKRRYAGHAGVNVAALHLSRPVEREQFLGHLSAQFGRVASESMLISTNTHSVARMRLLCRQVQARHQLSLVVVDYLQLCKASRKHDQRYRELAEISGDLKRLAVELNVPVIAVAQLNRTPEARADKRPRMADLAESDSLGRDCDWAVLIHRDPPPAQGESPGSTRDIADLIVDAHRDGMTGVARVRFDRLAVRFRSLAHGAS